MSIPASGARPARYVARNTLWNLLGYVLPIVVAVAAIPWLIAGIGPERFGFISLAWVVTGYFGLLDLGLGQSITRTIAASASEADRRALPEIIWNTALVQIAIGIAAGLLLAVLTPWLLDSVFRPSLVVREEAPLALLLLAISVPFVVVSSLYRGILEGCHRFDLVNVVRVPTSMLNYAGPVAALVFTPHLAALILVIAISRLLSCAAYVFLALREIPGLRSKWRLRLSSVRPLLRYASWLSLTNMLTPVVVSVDRLMIGAVVSLSAVGFYVAPYEVVTKLWIFSASLLGVLFPILSSLGSENEARSRIFRQAHLVLAFAALPFVAVVLAFAGELLRLWLGPDFARESSGVARWLVLGVFINILAQIPFTLLHGLGRSNVTAKSLLIQLPLFLGVVWWAAKAGGIEAVAMAWAIRATVDAVILYTAVGFTDARLRADLLSLARKVPPIVAITFAFAAIGLFLEPWLWAKIAVFSLCALVLAYWLWHSLLQQADRSTIIAWMHSRRG